MTTYRTLDALVAATPAASLEFVLVCVSGDANAPMLLRLAELGVPALSQTALAPGQTVEELVDLYGQLKDAKVQQVHAAISTNGRIGKFIGTHSVLLCANSNI